MSFPRSILEEARNFVFDLFQSASLQKYAYHNLSHTLSVVAAGKYLGRQHDLSLSDLEILELAALFHDTGYLHHWQGHEEASAEIACQFLRNQTYAEERIEQVIACILATKMPQRPGNLLERIICDSDLFHLTQDTYLSKAFLLREEMEETRGRFLSDAMFLNSEVRFLSQHQFKTAFVQKQFAHQKAKNIGLLHQLQQTYSLNVA